MDIMPMTFLGMGAFELVVILVVCAGGVISSIAKKIAEQKARAQDEARKRQAQMGMPAPGTPGASAQVGGVAPVSVEDLAARRRAELQRRTSRAASVSRPQSAGGAHPTNITMTQVQQREAAKREYARRAQVLREQYAKAHPSAPPGTSAPKTQIAGPTLDPDSVAVEDRPLPTSHHPVITAPVAPPKHAKPAPAAVSSTGRSASRQSAGAFPTASAVAIVTQNRPIPELHLAGKKLRLTPGVMRSAIALKEVLDPPVALR